MHAAAPIHIGIAIGLSALLTGQAPRGKPKPIDVTLATKVSRCPVRAPIEQQQLFANRLAASSTRLHALLGAALPAKTGAKPYRINIVDAGATARELAAKTCERTLHGYGIVNYTQSTAVLAPDKKQRDDQDLQRASIHMLTQQLVHDVLPRDVQDRLGYGWLATGLAHRLEAEFCGGGVACCMVGEAVQPPVTVWGGDWQRAAFELLRRGRLPPLQQLLISEAADFDLGQHVLTLAVIDWLLQNANAAPLTGAQQAQPKANVLAKMVAAAAAGKPALLALPNAAGRTLAQVEADMHAFVLKRTGINKPNRNAPLPHHPSHPHAAMFVYTREPIRPRHRRIVAKALKRRHSAHSSGWRRRGKLPDLKIGPVNRAGGFWHGDEHVKTIPRTWPMVAVLEYEPAGNPTAYLDCLRRVAGRNGEDGWMLDPGVGFVQHHNAQVVTDRDQRFHYLAIPDTPTGSHVGQSEFVHRGRVRWSDGRTATVGVWTSLHAPQSKTTAPWHAQQTPLVDWFVKESSKGLGAKAFAAVEDRERELAIWGTGRVLRFPVIPGGLTPGR